MNHHSPFSPIYVGLCTDTVQRSFQHWLLALCRKAQRWFSEDLSCHITGFFCFFGCSTWQNFNSMDYLCIFSYHVQLLVQTLFSDVCNFLMCAIFQDDNTPLLVRKTQKWSKPFGLASSTTISQYNRTFIEQQTKSYSSYCWWSATADLTRRMVQNSPNKRPEHVRDVIDAKTEQILYLFIKLPFNEKIPLFCPTPVHSYFLPDVWPWNLPLQGILLDSAL